MRSRRWLVFIGALASVRCASLLELEDGLPPPSAPDAACPEGLATCGDSPRCAVDLGRDTEHCGSCANKCAAIHAEAGCVLGRCSLLCEAPWGDCNLANDDGCEAALNDDARHCGRCGHDCLGGLCVEGRCLFYPLDVEITDPNGGGQIAAEGRTLYVSRASARSDLLPNTTPKATLVTSDDGGAGVSVIPTLPRVHAFSLTPSRIAFTEGPVFSPDGLWHVWSSDRDGGAERCIAKGRPESVAADDAFVYWHEDNGDGGTDLKRASTTAACDGGVTEAIATLSNTSPIYVSLAHDSKAFFYSVPGTFGARYEDGEIWRVDKASGTKIRLLRDIPFPQQLAVDGSSLYFRDEFLTIRRTSLLEPCLDVSTCTELVLPPSPEFSGGSYVVRGDTLLVTGTIPSTGTAILVEYRATRTSDQAVTKEVQRWTYTMPASPPSWNVAAMDDISFYWMLAGKIFRVAR